MMLVECKTCEAIIDGQLIAEYDNFIEEHLIQEKYSFLRCPKCASPFIMCNVNHVDDKDGWGEPWQLYPKRNINKVTVKSFYNLPINLRRIYGELVNCFNNDSPILCAAGLRAIVEGICAQQGVRDGLIEEQVKEGGTRIKRSNNLEGRIAGLQQKGFLTQSSAQILHEHRYLGNNAVHQLARPSEDELRLAIEIIEHTLHQLYELPEKAEELKRATARRKK